MLAEMKKNFKKLQTYKISAFKKVGWARIYVVRHPEDGRVGVPKCLLWHGVGSNEWARADIWRFFTGILGKK